MDLGSAAERGDAVVWSVGSEIDEQVHSWTDFRDHGFSSDHGLTFANQRLDAFRQIQIRPAAKSYDAQAIAAMYGVALSKRAEDAASDQTGDLHNHQFPSVSQSQSNRIPLVCITRLIQAGVEKRAMPIGNPGNRPIDRYAIDMDVQDGEKNRDAPSDRRRKSKFGGRDAWCDRYDESVRGCQNGAGSPRRHTCGIAEEIEAEQASDQGNQRQPMAYEKADQQYREATDNERPAGRMRWRKDGS